MIKHDNITEFNDELPLTEKRVFIVLSQYWHTIFLKLLWHNLYCLKHCINKDLTWEQTESVIIVDDHLLKVFEVIWTLSSSAIVLDFKWPFWMAVSQHGMWRSVFLGKPSQRSPSWDYGWSCASALCAWIFKSWAGFHAYWKIWVGFRSRMKSCQNFSGGCFHIWTCSSIQWIHHRIGSKFSARLKEL